MAIFTGPALGESIEAMSATRQFRWILATKVRGLEDSLWKEILKARGDISTMGFEDQHGCINVINKLGYSHF